MIELVVISRLLEYPDAALWQHQGELFDVLSESEKLEKADAQALGVFLRDLTAQDLLDAQAAYSELFDRGRATSLLLFEHVHGESRDRGQAMVDLMAQYEAAGFEIGIKELPDYLPMYLEFLAYQASQTDDTMQIRMDIADISHILTVLAARLIDKNSAYASLFKALLQIAGKPLSVIDDELAKMGKDKVDDTTFEAIDQEWEEEAVNFLAAKQEERCPSSQTDQRIAETLARQAQNESEIPVHWVDFKTNKTVSQGVLS